MIKIIRTTVAMVLAAGATYAGSAVFIAPEVTMVEEPMRSGSGAWLIPLAIIAILALTLTGGEETDPSAI